MEQLPNPHKLSTRPARERFMRYGATMLSALALTAVGSFIAGCGSNASTNKSSRSATTSKSIEPGASSSPKPKPSANQGPKLTIKPGFLTTGADICSLIPPSVFPADESGVSPDGCKTYVASPTELYGVYDGGSNGGVIDIKQDADQQWLNRAKSGTGAATATVGPVVDGTPTSFDSAALVASVGGYFVDVAAGLDTAPKSANEALDAKIMASVIEAAFTTPAAG